MSDNYGVQIERLAAQVALEHENFLTVHRDNMALVLRVAAQAQEIKTLRERLEAK